MIIKMKKNESMLVARNVMTFVRQKILNSETHATRKSRYSNLIYAKIYFMRAVLFD